MKKIIFFQVALVCLYASAQMPKPTVTPAKSQVNKQVVDEIIIANVPGFVSPIIAIPYKGLVVAPLPAQAKDDLLWYKGKKVNDSILITPDAKLVLYSKSRNIIVLQPPPKKDPWLKTIKRMQAIEQEKKKLLDATADKPNAFFLYPHVTAAFKEYDEQNEDYAKALKNAIPLPEAVSTVAAPYFSTGGYASIRFVFATGVPRGVKQAYEEVMHKKKNYSPLDFPPPPQKDFGACYEYDGKAQNQYAIDRYKWEQEFTKYEKDLVNRSLSIYKTIEQLKLNADPEAIQIKGDLNKVIEFAFARMKNKVELLIKNYGNDFSRLPSIIRVTISVEREKQLMDATEDASSQTIDKLVSLLDGFDEYLNKQTAARNYDLVLNLGFLIGMERQRQLLGGEEKNNMPAIIEKFKAFNRFKMQKEVDFAYSCKDKDGTCQYLEFAASLATQEDFYISLIPYKYGGYQIYLTNTIYKPEVEEINRQLDYQSSETGKYDLELKASDGHIKSVFIDDEGNQHIKTESLVGAELLSHLPAGRIYFCREKEDTLYLMGFYPKGGMANRIAYGMHLDMNLMIANVSEEELAPHMQEIVGNAESYQKRMKSFEVEPTKFETLDKMQNQYSIVEMYQKNAENIAKYVSTKDAAVLFDAENGNQEIMNARVDVSGKTIENLKINKGIIKIKITHDPLPYKNNDGKKN